MTVEPRVKTTYPVAEAVFPRTCVCRQGTIGRDDPYGLSPLARSRPHLNGVSKRQKPSGQWCLFPATGN